VSSPTVFHAAVATLLSPVCPAAHKANPPPRDSAPFLGGASSRGTKLTHQLEPRKRARRHMTDTIHRKIESYRYRAKNLGFIDLNPVFCSSVRATCGRIRFFQSKCISSLNPRRTRSLRGWSNGSLGRPGRAAWACRDALFDYTLWYELCSAPLSG
jgi:hypothetical protein